MKKEHEILFEPFKIGTVMIKNRFVLEPMEGTNMIDCLPIFKIGEDIHDYYVERAKNHVGLIIPGMVTLRSMVGKQWLYEQKEILLPQKTKKTDCPGAPRTGCADPWYCRIWKWAG